LELQPHQRVQNFHIDRNDAVEFKGRNANDVFLVMEDISRNANSLATQFKVCPLCGGINSVEVSSCFVCSWHGEFDNDPVAIANSFDELIERCPGLMEAVSPATKPTVWQKILAMLGVRRVDLSA
jgi:hypothetical protein